MTNSDRDRILLDAMATLLHAPRPQPGADPEARAAFDAEYRHWYEGERAHLLAELELLGAERFKPPAVH